MKLRCLFVLALALAAGSGAQAQPVTNSVDDLVAAGEQFARENLDPEVLRLFEQADRDRIEQFLQALQHRFDGDYVLDLPALEDTAKAVLPLLEAHEETQSYAAWLRARLDYFQAAGELRRAVTPPKPKPGEAPAPAPVPGPELERKVWTRQLELRPWPKAAGDLVPRLKPIFTGEKVPSELVWVAEVESSFDPRARSPSGAVGLFQLTPDTARRMGLSLWPWDERKRPEPSARAAAKYLAYLHRQFNDWRLALAAYNAGEGRVRLLLDRQKIKSFDAIAVKLPAETQMFVPKVEATLLKREGVRLTRLKSPAG